MYLKKVFYSCCIENTQCVLKPKKYKICTFVKNNLKIYKYEKVNDNYIGFGVWMHYADGSNVCLSQWRNYMAMRSNDY